MTSSAVVALLALPVLLAVTAGCLLLRRAYARAELLPEEIALAAAWGFMAGSLVWLGVFLSGSTLLGFGAPWTWLAAAHFAAACRTLGLSIARPRQGTSRHAECMAAMTLGASILSPARMQLRTLAMFAAWESEEALDAFLTDTAPGRTLSGGWPVRLAFLRRRRHHSGFADLPANVEDTNPSQPVVAVTLARLKLPELVRFIRWGKPVEKQVSDHPGTTLALAAIRPPRTFSTFSIWRSQHARQCPVASASSFFYRNGVRMDAGRHNPCKVSAMNDDTRSAAEIEDCSEVDITLETQRDQFVVWFLEGHPDTNKSAVDRVLDEAVARIRPSTRASEIARAIEQLIGKPR